MIYQLTGVEEQIDFGYGVTGESYYNSAEVLLNNNESIEVMQLKELPLNFLYRHSIELFLKSLIIICHKKLEINYNEDDFNSKKPKIFYSGEWRLLHRCHWLNALYDYWRNMVDDNFKKLTELSGPYSHWQKEGDIEKLLYIIAKYDNQSSFFRYPVTENKEGDLEKFSMTKVDIKSLQEIFEKKRKVGKMTTIFLDEEENVKRAYTSKEEPLEEVSQALRKVAHYFYCIHIMARNTLCKGF